MPRRPPLFRHGLDAVARNSGIISLPFPPFLNNPHIYIYIFIYATKMDRNFKRGRHLCRGGGCSRTDFETFTSGTFDDKSGERGREEVNLDWNRFGIGAASRFPARVKRGFF